MKTIAVTVVGLAIALAFGYEFRPGTQQQKKINETWETTNDRFKIGVTAYAEEKGGFAGGSNYVFTSAKVGSDDWKEFMTFRHDDPIPIPRQQIHFVNDKIAYVFIGWMYAVTTDGGSSWSVWNAENDLPGWRCCNYGLIQDLRVEPDGVGKMKLKPIMQRDGEVPELHTRDYGRHWISN
ncbi:MAG TPA: hypothetical protein DC047_09355 [Blastocatellia bacterium]|nr:hypothetical protein [Blastocatellia bacterium]